MYDLDYYRGITLTSNVYKVYAKIIEQSVMSYMEDNGILGQVDGGFQTGQTDEGQHFYSTRDMCTQKTKKRVKHSSLFQTFLKL